MVLIATFDIPDDLKAPSVSVPLRGLWFLSTSRKGRNHHEKNKFPSPYGDYGSYLIIIGLTSKIFRFPSPYGDYGSYHGSPSTRMHSRMLFPSPYGDYGSYRIARDFKKPLDTDSFRPLTGIMVLIRTPYKWLHSAIENAFCGADFLFSSFFTFLWKMIFKNCPIADF